MAHVEKRGERKYRARYRGPDGRERSKTFTTEREARRWLTSVEHSKLRGEWVDPNLGRVTVKEWAARWWPTTTGMRPTTRVRDEVYLRTRVVAHFGDWPLSGVQHLDVQAWVAQLEASGLSPATVHKCHQILVKVMGAAVRGGMLASSPCEGVELPTMERQEMRFLDPDDVDTLASAIDPRYRPLVFVGAYGGLRAGEMFGLRRARVDLMRRSIDVAEILTEVRGHHVFGPPTTRAGRRVVPVPRVVADELEAHLTGVEPGALVFPAPAGGPVRASLFRRRVWHPAVERAGLAPLRLHDLRHTAVALWIAAGASPKEIATRTGHTSVSVVLDRYGHLLPGSEDKVNDALDALAAGGRRRARAHVVALR